MKKILGLVLILACGDAASLYNSTGAPYRAYETDIRQPDPSERTAFIVLSRSHSDTEIARTPGGTLVPRPIGRAADLTHAGRLAVSPRFYAACLQDTETGIRLSTHNWIPFVTNTIYYIPCNPAKEKIIQHAVEQALEATMKVESPILCGAIPRRLGAKYLDVTYKTRLGYTSQEFLIEDVDKFCDSFLATLAELLPKRESFWPQETRAAYQTMRDGLRESFYKQPPKDL